MTRTADELGQAAVAYLADRFNIDEAALTDFLGAGKTEVQRIVDDLTADPLGGDRPTAGPGADPIRRAVHDATNRGI